MTNNPFFVLFVILVLVLAGVINAINTGVHLAVDEPGEAVLSFIATFVCAWCIDRNIQKFRVLDWLAIYEGIWTGHSAEDDELLKRVRTAYDECEYEIAKEAIKKFEERREKRAREGGWQ